jgi:hypothetical protein
VQTVANPLLARWLTVHQDQEETGDLGGQGDRDESTGDSGATPARCVGLADLFAAAFGGGWYGDERPDLGVRDAEQCVGYPHPVHARAAEPGRLWRVLLGRVLAVDMSSTAIAATACSTVPEHGRSAQAGHG